MKPTSKQSPIKRQSNALSTAAYSLPRNSKRLIYLCLDQLANRDTLKHNTEEAGYEVVVNHADYTSVFGKNTNTSRDIRGAAVALRQNGIVVFMPELDGDDGEKAFAERNWINGFKHEPRKKQTKLYFHPFVVEKLHLGENTAFTKYALKHLSKLDNSNAMRLYETICQWRNKRSSFKFSIKWFLERYCLPNSYSRIADFRNKFLARAKEEINEHTDITITDIVYYKQGKNKNSVTHVEIFWKEKEKEAEKTIDSFEPTLEQAVQTHADLYDSETGKPRRLPNKKEIDNLKAHLAELLLDGFPWTPEILANLKLAEQNLDSSSDDM
ncbi:RepB family plasmid replication initiator protein [Photobacterium leiognathi]|uniref:RepB family plasmid replication initiator protein n=1 Tax=Photobacterium leiognathi TaxID=553611 RepID=UPI0029826312|nr:RepB family plasmid replication initiator protein [Photobacterium leiognathi]